MHSLCSDQRTYNLRVRVGRELVFRVSREISLRSLLIWLCDMEKAVIWLQYHSSIRNPLVEMQSDSAVPAHKAHSICIWASRSNPDQCTSPLMHASYLHVLFPRESGSESFRGILQLHTAKVFSVELEGTA